MNRLILFVVCGLTAFASGAEAQQVLSECTQTSRSSNQIGENHVRLAGNVEIECPDMKFYADEVVLFTDTHRLVATGNVVFVSETSQLGADRVEFDTDTHTGRFYNASGSASLGEHVERSLFGTQEPDAYFYGEIIEKLGPRTYRITRGAFTTCVQPTPRWEVGSSSITVTLDKHAVLKSAVLRVKNVPMFYFPVMYYPLKEDDRATGLLIPTYGVSTYRGQTLSNAFFWAVNRSQDATFFHDWYSKTGQGFGGEYRYVAAPGSEGGARVYFLREHEAKIEQPGGGAALQPARRSYQIRAGASQSLPGGLRAQGSVDYFSDVSVLQTYYTSIYDMSRRSRSYTGILNGTWGRSSLSGSWAISQLFYSTDISSRYGGAPRISFSQSQTQIGRAPLFVAVSSDFSRQVYETHYGQRLVDQGLTRFDLQPVLRVPLNRLAFLTWDSSVVWSGTYYTESLNEKGVQVPVPLWRKFFDLRSELVGPVFVRIWNTPTNGYAEKIKHIIEPTVQFRYLSPIETANSSVKFGTSDYLVGGNLQMRYALTSRLLAKRHQAGGVSSAREIFTVSAQQTYYTDKIASQFDPAYSTSFYGRKPSDLSPIAIGISGAPTDNFSASVSMDYDLDLHGFQTIGIRGSGGGPWMQVSGGISRRRLLRGGYILDNFVNADITLHEPGMNQYGGTFSFNYDNGRHVLIQQRLIGYYNAQCCGVAVEYQTYNFPALDPRYMIPKDRRFNISFTLAGIGTFSNFFGALAGTPNRR